MKTLASIGGQPPHPPKNGGERATPGPVFYPAQPFCCDTLPRHGWGVSPGPAAALQTLNISPRGLNAKGEIPWHSKGSNQR